MSEAMNALAIANKVLDRASADPDDDIAVLARQYLRIREALYMCAASCQGGHSAAGRAAAHHLNVGFPINMESMEVQAKRDGLDPEHLWPWYVKMKREKIT
jgi:hypothetical protein